MSCKIRWDIPTDHPKNCRCTPCLSVNVFDKKPPMTISIRETLTQKQADSLMLRTGFNVVAQHLGKAAEAFKRIGEAARSINSSMVVAANPNPPQDPALQLIKRTQHRTSMSNMRGPS